MSKPTRFTVALLMWMALSVTTAGSVAAAPSKKAALLYATTLNTATVGVVRVHIGEGGLRMDFQKNGSVLVASAPNWKVAIYNPGGKRIYHQQKAVWEGGVTTKYLQMMSRSPRDLDWVKVKSDSKNARYKAEQPAVALSNASKKRLRRFIARAELVTDVGTVGIPKVALSIFDKTLSCPDVDGFPLSMTTTSGIMERSSFIEVRKELQKVPFDKRLFELPKDFQKVDSEGKVESASAEALIEDMSK